MKDILNEITWLTSQASTEPTATDLPGVVIIKGEVPEHQLAAIYEPMIGFIIEGSKTVSIGDQVIYLKPPSYFVIPTEIPATGRVHQGPNGLPYLSVGLYLNQNSILDLLKDLPNDFQEGKVSNEFSACEATIDFLEAWLRMLRLLKTPKHIPALAPVYEREILYRVLLGPQGWRLTQFCRTNDKGSGIHQSIRWIRKNYSESMEIKRMAAKSHMGITTFHRQFKQITGLSPIQFQKQLRLLEARKLLVFSGYSVSHAAFKVGYESASQFNREYSKFFGASPARDTSSLRQMESQRLVD
ncbi:AraC family transcriptional regulator N-terminal domain-containing protein [Leptospira sp. 'Mane']|uniref:AraC family transcriptional regulator n=1 Tax=Leptospira sp. 'Mane' TaxID=3387407 RepID=UPI00398A8C12